MLSASALMISQGVRTVAAMMSPEKNPCRVRMVSASQTQAAVYRYDPYASKVLSSPMKTQLVSPVKPASSSAPPTTTTAQFSNEGVHRNSLFAAPVAKKVITAPSPVEGVPVSFRAAAERVPTSSVYPPVVAKTSSTAVESAKSHYAVIYFKHDSATFIAPFRIKEGDHVVVEGDRGVDIGVVGGVTTETPNYPVPLKIVRRATSNDLEAFVSKQRKEQIVMRQVQALAESLDLGIQVIDTEFQFDNNKLTVFFHTQARGHIDFRKLQRGLFREHRCRIWLSNMAEVEYNAQLQKTRRTR